jgi:hypothetical protein
VAHQIKNILSYRTNLIHRAADRKIIDGDLAQNALVVYDEESTKK